ncbi:MAG: hypothetical protein ACJZ84_04200, partial [Paracoccaceae bacterium]
MSRLNIFRASIPFVAPLLLSACQPQDFGKVKPDFTLIKKIPTSIMSIGKRSVGAEMDTPLPLKDILGDSLATKNPGSDFLASIKYALDTDPEIISKRREAEAKLASLRAVEAQKYFQVRTTLYGGIEDVTDNTKGLALAINASRLVFDGGKLDSEIT